MTCPFSLYVSSETVSNLGLGGGDKQVDGVLGETVDIIKDKFIKSGSPGD